ncbi:MAG: hypothetical protein AB8B84_06755 [Granulosicoccus sp.]
MPCYSENFSADVFMQKNNRIRIIANHPVSVDHCDLSVLTSEGIVITYRLDGLSNAVGEYTQ